MELQFHKTSLPCLRQILSEIKDQEQTQEVKLPDGMPDIGSILGAWGQVLIRGKEWRSDSVGVTGGVMAWVLYAPEDGTQPRMVEAWIPFQMKWDIPDTQRDGHICVSGLLRLMDARSVSARKLMLRAVVSLLAQAMVPSEADIYSPGEIPEDVQLLINTYPVRIPSEAGEKAFVLDEELTLPAGCPKPEKLIHYTLQPEIVDKKVMAGKIVFRGMAILQVLYRAEDESLHNCSMDIPISQYSELDREYDPEASATISPALTSLELEIGEEGKLRLKAGLAGQYVVYDRTVLSLVEDAYSAQREVTPQSESLQVPLVLEQSSTTVHAQCPRNAEGEAVDLAFFPDQPRQSRNGNTVETQLAGRFQILYWDAEGKLRGETCKWEERQTMDADENSTLNMTLWPSGKVQEDGADLRLETVTTARQGMETVTGLILGEQTQKDPNRPSLILCRAGADGLWSLAKRTGSTVDAIRKANNLEAEPDPARLLLIPVS